VRGRVLLLMILALLLFLITGCSSKEERGIRAYNKGMAFLENKNYDEAIGEFKYSCSNGIKEGCYMWGKVLEQEEASFFVTRWWYGDDIYKAYANGCKLGYKKGCYKAQKWIDYKNEEPIYDDEWGIVEIIEFMLFMMVAVAVGMV
jgi:hypothetical protein